MSGLAALKLHEQVPEAFVLMLREQILAEHERNTIDSVAFIRTHHI